MTGTQQGWIQMLRDSREDVKKCKIDAFHHVHAVNEQTHAVATRIGHQLRLRNPIPNDYVKQYNSFDIQELSAINIH